MTDTGNRARKVAENHLVILKSSGWTLEKGELLWEQILHILHIFQT